MFLWMHFTVQPDTPEMRTHTVLLTHEVHASEIKNISLLWAPLVPRYMYVLTQYVST